MRLSDEEITELTRQYRVSGAIELRDRLIISHMPLALSYMQQTAYRGFTRYEYLSELFYALVDGVTKAQTNLIDNNITPYLKSCLKSRAIHYRSRLPLIRVPRKMYSKGVRPPKIKFLRPEHSKSQNDRSDLLEFVFSNAEQVVETQIVLGLIEGKNYEEIGQELGLTRARISQISSQMRARMQKLLKDSENVNYRYKDRDAKVAAR